MTDTPETDAIAEMAHNLVLDWDCRDRGDTTEKPVVVTAEFARRLERERDEARRDAAMWKSNHDNQVELKSIISKRGDLKDRAPRVEKLIAERDHWCDMHSIASKGRDQLRAINAELLEALDFMYNGSSEKDQTKRLAQVRQSLAKAKEDQP
jgi:hypothetical protein